jgi:tellurium resistance protein TerD
MTIQLSKGENINLSKTSPHLKKVRVGLGWSAKVTDGGYDFDLDASAFVLREVDGRQQLLNENYFIFYNNLSSPEGAVIHMGDNRTGNGEGDDEQIVTDLDKMPVITNEVSFVVTIDQADVRKQNFGQVKDAYIHLVNDETGEELARYDLTEDFGSETALQFGSLYMKGGDWKFKAVGAGYHKGLAAFIEEYGCHSVGG